MFQRKNEFCHFGEIKNEIEDSIFICKLFFRLGTHHYVTFSIRPSIRLSVRLSNHPSVCHTPYLRNSKAFDHDFWYTCVKWRYLQGVFFSFFLKFWFFGLLGGGGHGGRSKREKNGPRWQKNSVLHFISQEPYIIWSWFMIHMWKGIIYPVFVFTFFPNFNFWGQ